MSDSRPLTRIEQGELDTIVQKHAMFRTARLGGVRAILAQYDLSNLSMRGMDLSHADLTGAADHVVAIVERDLPVVVCHDALGITVPHAQRTRIAPRSLNLRLGLKQRRRMLFREHFCYRHGLPRFTLPSVRLIREVLDPYVHVASDLILGTPADDEIKLFRHAVGLIDVR